MEHIDAKTFKEKLNTDPHAVLIDVRHPDEEVEGLIEGSINLNIMENSFPAKVMDLDPSNTYYVYCRSGSRSANACQFMEQQGLKSYNLKGGIQAWNQLEK